MVDLLGFDAVPQRVADRPEFYTVLSSGVQHAFVPRLQANTSKIGEWLSLVEHLVRDQGVGGSNPLSPTIYLAQFVLVKPRMRLLLCPQFSVHSVLSGQLKDRIPEDQIRSRTSPPIRAETAGLP